MKSRSPDAIGGGCVVELEKAAAVAVLQVAAVGNQWSEGWRVGSGRTDMEERDWTGLGWLDGRESWRGGEAASSVVGEREWVCGNERTNERGWLGGWAGWLCLLWARASKDG